MHEVPAAWYDDPEDPSQYRYWDGTQWTDHRAPKHVSAAPRGRGGVIAETWELGKQTIGPLLGIAALYFLILLPALIVVGIGAAQSLDPGLGEIFERMGSPDWDPNGNASDRAFQDSIEWNPTSFFWVAVVGAAVYAIPVSVLAYGMAIMLMANRYRGGSMPFGEAWSLGFKRFWRNLRISLLWMLVYLAVLAPLAGLWALAIWVTPYAWALAVPLSLGLLIYFYPFMWLALTALYTGPTDTPPWRSVLALVKPQWTDVAGPVLLINIVIIAFNLLATAVNVIPILGSIVALVLGVGQWIAQHGSGVVLWDRFGGDYDPEVVDPSVTSPFS